MPDASLDIELSIMIDTRITEVTLKKGDTIEYRSGFGVAGVELNNALIEYLKTHYNLLIGRLTAENIILQYGSVLPLEDEQTTAVQGRDMSSGYPNKATFTATEVRLAINDVLDHIVSNVTLSLTYNLNRMSKEIQDAVMTNGIILRGDFGKIKRLDERFQEATGLKVTVE